MTPWSFASGQSTPTLPSLLLDSIPMPMPSSRDFDTSLTSRALGSALGPAWARPGGLAHAGWIQGGLHAPHPAPHTSRTNFFMCSLIYRRAGAEQSRAEQGLMTATGRSDCRAGQGLGQGLGQCLGQGRRGSPAPPSHTCCPTLVQQTRPAGVKGRGPGEQQPDITL